MIEQVHLRPPLVSTCICECRHTPYNVHRTHTYMHMHAYTLSACTQNRALFKKIKQERKGLRQHIRALTIPMY